MKVQDWRCAEKAYGQVFLTPRSAGECAARAARAALAWLFVKRASDAIGRSVPRRNLNWAKLFRARVGAWCRAVTSGATSRWPRSRIAEVRVRVAAA